MEMRRPKRHPSHKILSEKLVGRISSYRPWLVRIKHELNIMVPGYFPQTNPRQSANSTSALHGLQYARSIPPKSKTLTKELSTCSSITCDLPDVDAIIIQKLRQRSYHLPGNNFYQDLCMYMKNNNLVFGLCCHHPLHPVTLRHRLVILMGSLAFGLSATNVVYLYYLYGRMDDVKSTDVAISFTFGFSGGDSGDGGGGEAEGATATITTHYQWVNNNTLTIDISHGMAILWTVGAAAHSMFDYIVWHMVACAYTDRKCCRYFGWSLAVSIVMLLVALTSFVTLLRATASSIGEESDATATTLTMPGLEDIQHVVGGYGIVKIHLGTSQVMKASAQMIDCTLIHRSCLTTCNSVVRIILVVVQAVHTEMLVLMNLRLRPLPRQRMN